MIERGLVFSFFFPRTFVLTWKRFVHGSGATNERDKGNRAAVRSGKIGLTTMWFIASERWLILYPLFDRSLPIGVRTMIKPIDGCTARERGIGRKYGIFSMIGWRRKLRKILTIMKSNRKSSFSIYPRAIKSSFQSIRLKLGKFWTLISRDS